MEHLSADYAKDRKFLLIKMGFHKIWVDKDYNAGALGGFTYGVTTEEMAGGYAKTCQ